MPAATLPARFMLEGVDTLARLGFDPTALGHPVPGWWRPLSPGMTQQARQVTRTTRLDVLSRDLSPVPELVSGLITWANLCNLADTADGRPADVRLQSIVLEVALQGTMHATVEHFLATLDASRATGRPERAAALAELSRVAHTALQSSQQHLQAKRAVMYDRLDPMQVLRRFTATGPGLASAQDAKSLPPSERLLFRRWRFAAAMGERVGLFTHNGVDSDRVRELVAFWDAALDEQTAHASTEPDHTLVLAHPNRVSHKAWTSTGKPNRFTYSRTLAFAYYPGEHLTPHEVSIHTVPAVVARACAATWRSKALCWDLGPADQVTPEDVRGAARIRAASGATGPLAHWDTALRAHRDIHS